MTNVVGQVLGTETYQDLVVLVKGLIEQSWQQSYTARDMRILMVGFLIVVILVLYQTYHVMTDRRHKRGWGVILGMVIFDVLAFWLVVMAQLRVYYWLLDVRAPRSVVVERLTPELVSVRYQTYDPEIGIVYWGYEEDQLSYAALDQNPSKKTRIHEILISPEPRREIYLKIGVGSELYGLNSSRNTNSYGVAGSP